MRRLVTTALVASVLVLGGSRAASACSCAAGPLPDALQRADGAFVGTLVAKDPPPGSDGPVVNVGAEVAYHFAVERSVKGEIPRRVAVHASGNGASCGIEVPVGGRTGLLLRRGTDGRWQSSLCEQADAGRLVSASALPSKLAAVATLLLIAVATAARHSVRRSGWPAAHGAIR